MSPVGYKILLKKNYLIHEKHLLFAHVCCGCDTNSGINKLGKTQTLGSLSRTPEHPNLADKFYNDDITCTTLG